jgi:hypothetical protein
MAEIVRKKKLFMVEIRPFPLERGAQKDPDNVCPKQAERVSSSLMSCAPIRNQWSTDRDSW